MGKTIKKTKRSEKWYEETNVHSNEAGGPKAVQLFRNLAEDIEDFSSDDVDEDSILYLLTAKGDGDEVDFGMLDVIATLRKAAVMAEAICADYIETERINGTGPNS